MLNVNFVVGFFLSIYFPNNYESKNVLFSFLSNYTPHSIYNFFFMKWFCLHREHKTPDGIVYVVRFSKRSHAYTTRIAFGMWCAIDRRQECTNRTQNLCIDVGNLSSELKCNIGNHTTTQQIKNRTESNDEKEWNGKYTTRKYFRCDGQRETVCERLCMCGSNDVQLARQSSHIPKMRELLLPLYLYTSLALTFSTTICRIKSPKRWMANT